MTQSDPRATLHRLHEKWPGQLDTARAAQRRESSDAPRTYPPQGAEGSHAERGHGRQPHSEPQPPHLRVADSPAPKRPKRPKCRSRACVASVASASATGYCTDCQAVHDAVLALRERLLERYGRRLRPSHQALLREIAPAERDRLLAHLAARHAHHRPNLDGITLVALEDFLQDLGDADLPTEWLT